MLKIHINSILLRNLGHTPTSGQEVVLDMLSEVILDPGKREIILLKGFAGTGKTTLIRSFVKVLRELQLKSVLLAPTGRAAKVLANIAGKEAFTIHKKIYRQKSSKDGFGKFVLEENLHSNTFFIVDEASMISNSSFDNSIFGSGRVLDDLVKYVYNDKRCKLILIGDTAQLPPVGLEISPALDPTVLKGYGMTVREGFLDEVVRQSEDSGILFNATKVRKLLSKKSFELPSVKLENFTDITRVFGVDLVEEITSTYDRDGLENSIIVVRSNKMANRYNQGIRNEILWREEEVSTGDYLMVVKNNYFWLQEDESVGFIANGDILEILKIKGYQERYGFRFADMVFKLLDYTNIEFEAKVLLDTLHVEAASLSNEENKKLFYSILEDYSEESSKKKQFESVRENKFFNALQVKFGYAVTCHKAQGGQWKNVFVDQGFLSEDMVNIEYLRWLYTAITRATSNLYLVNFSDKFFE
ncbi:MAG: AAA family ATPase [Bacteroidetes bacterium]|nr:AAA family ATPase [Bacteroidota bacterium]